MAAVLRRSAASLRTMASRQRAFSVMAAFPFEQRIEELVRAARNPPPSH